MRPTNRWMLLTLLAAALLLSACGRRAETHTKIEPAQVVKNIDTGVGVVTITPRAAERLGLLTEAVREERVSRTRVVGGEVVAAPGATDGSVLVQVAFGVADAAEVDARTPATVLPLALDGNSGIAAAPAFDEAVDGVALAYRIDGNDHGLEVGQRVRIALPLEATNSLKKVIPYSAVIYDLNGETFTYTAPEPLTYVREPITVEFIEGGDAVLSDGPAVGVEVISVGAAEIFGTEFGVGK